MIKNVYPALVEAIQSIAAPAVRNRGTVGGNIMGGEGDLIPLLLAMQAEMTFLHEDGLKTIEMLEWLKNRDNDALLVKVTIPAPRPIFYKKIGRRETFTAAILTVSGQITCTDTQVIDQVVLAIGGGGNIPLRLVKTEQCIINKTIQQINWKHVYQSILDEYCPTTDAFVTSNYKKKVAANLIISEMQRLWSTQIKREVHVHEM
jgi:xanthine dehydrogenase C subunit